VEVLHVAAKGDEKVFEDLIRFFFVFHDPTTENRQGADQRPYFSSFWSTFRKVLLP
jgi:peptide methionine sulfoxide reductase MsrA